MTSLTAIEEQDFALINKTLTFIDDRNVQAFYIVVYGDSEAEFVEEARIRINIGSYYEQRIITIIDDDGKSAIVKQTKQIEQIAFS